MRLDDTATLAIRRGGAILISVGLISSLGVYAGHHWYHQELLPALGIDAALGDALGGFIIILIAYICQRIASLVIFRDTEFGTLRVAQELRETNREILSEMRELEHLAGTDKLTGAWSRHRFEEAIKDEMERLTRYGHPLSLLIIDIDHFKKINDTFGHDAGDRALIQLSGLLQEGLRNADSVTRWGGEEFIVLCPNTTLSTATVLADRLRRETEHMEFPGMGCITVSIGVSECQAAETWENWFKRTDAALYQAKKAGRNRVQVSPNMPGHVSESKFQNFVKLVWHPAYECGHEEIDQQHIHLFDDANDLLLAILSERSAIEIGPIVDKLITDISRHFDYEEAIILAAGYPDAKAHVAEHRELLKRAAIVVERVRDGSADIGELFKFLAHDVVSKHLLRADRGYFPYLSKAT